ncbi:MULTISPECIES: sorbosone dehydrogenase family protein [unclassified Sphingomonas]|uniref:PQQ-dependent sugar dehydrogenase n=1 Tax=unclassified Sphingomonas TaxID=196159 RepID=UPI00160E624B|nr:MULTISPECIES: sorbosone dehydrogenase family protein [unclassified Sphingomonas]MBB3348476.1 glucose/arabinose dehydrogenase [Sphingomonas sp. BK069]MBB3474968.1 glucose/arabinose dehydrogenase [Sphingomonas sp. BK345]
MTRRLTFVLVALPLAACGSGQQIDQNRQYGANPVLPAPHEQLVADVGVYETVGWKKGETPTVPAGFRIEPLASGLSNPRNVVALPNGDVLVIESRNEGKEPVQRPKDPIRDWVMARAHSQTQSGDAPAPSNRLTLLSGAAGDGPPAARSILVDKLNAPFGVVALGGQLYVADTDAIMRYPFTPGQTRITAPATRLTPLPAGTINHHWTKSLTASPDGTRLYVGVGSNSNAMERGSDAERDRAAIFEVDPRTGASRPFATGLRNPNGLTFYPGTNTLWAVINERDELGPNLVPDYLTSVRPGAFYGWPYSYYGQHLDPRVKPQRPDLVARAIAPDYALGSHVAPLGLAFYTGASFPAGYRGGAFVGEHGSWNRTAPHGYKVTFIAFRDARPIGVPRDFVTGFLKDGKARGRPVGVAIDPRGRLLIADDVGGTVWRVSYARG